MFYLRQFFKFIHTRGVAGYLFLFFSLSTLSVSMIHTSIQRMLQQRFQVARPLPSFHVLVIGEQDVGPIKHKLLNISGVKRIDVQPAAHLQHQAKELLGDLGLQELYRDESYQGLQVFIGRQQAERNYSLIQEYLSRLLGQSNVSFGVLKYPKMGIFETKRASIQFLQRWGYLAGLLVLGLCWLLSFLSIANDLQRYCYLIEQYQRRKHTAQKVLGIGLSMLLIPA